MLSPRRLKTAVVVGPGMVLSSLSSTRIHFSFPAITFISLSEKHTYCRCHPWPRHARRRQDAVPAPLQLLLLPTALPLSLLSTDALGSRLHWCILGLWLLSSFPPLQPGVVARAPEAKGAHTPSPSIHRHPLPISLSSLSSGSGFAAALPQRRDPKPQHLSSTQG